jgi:hypothetical protein
MEIHIPEYIRETLNKSPNASPSNNIIVTQIDEKIYSARWNLQPNRMELDQLWEVNCEKELAK